MKKIALLALLSLTLSACSDFAGTDASYDGISRTAPGHPLCKGTHFSPCKQTDLSGRCVRYIEPSEMCVNPKGMNATPAILPCPKDKNGNPIPFK